MILTVLRVVFGTTRRWIEEQQVSLESDLTSQTVTVGPLERNAVVSLLESRTRTLRKTWVVTLSAFASRSVAARRDLGYELTAMQQRPEKLSSRKPCFIFSSPFCAPGRAALSAPQGQQQTRPLAYRSSKSHQLITLAPPQHPPDPHVRFCLAFGLTRLASCCATDRG